MKFFCSFCFILLMSTGALNAQVSYYNFNVNNGLPSNEVYCVFQDKAGYMWFGTDHGVARYNGHQFEIFTTRNGLTDNIVFSIKQSPDGLIWFLTYTGGICYYDGKGFYPHPMNDTLRPLGIARIPMSWSVMPGKVVWLSYINVGFYRAAPEGIRAFQRWTNSQKVDSVNFYIITLKDSQYIYTNIINFGLPEIHHADISYYQHICVDSATWVSPGQNFQLLKLSSKRCLYGALNETGFFSDKKIIKGQKLEGKDKLAKIEWLSDSTIWITYVQGGAIPFDLTDQNLHPQNSIFPINSISDIFLDCQGNYWITSADQGIFMFQNKNIKMYSQSFSDPQKKVNALNTNGDQNLYVSYAHGPILKIDRTMKAQTLSATVQDRAFYFSGIAGIDKNTLLPPSIDFQKILRIKAYIHKLVQISKDTFIVCSEGFALVGKNKILFDSRQKGYFGRTTAICGKSRFEYMLGTLSGLLIFSYHDSAYFKWEPLLKNLYITACKKLNDSCFAVSTRGKGVFLLLNGHYHNIALNKGLISDLIEDVYFQNDSTVWAASFEGISKVNFHLAGDSLITKIFSYTREDGLCSNQITSVCGFNGYIWLGTNEGLCYFKPADLKDDTVKAPLYFQDILINGARKEGKMFDLPFNQNNLLINFTALYYKSSSGIRYRVRLKEDDPWTYTNQNFVQYFNLQPGKYTFQVQAVGKFGKYRSDVESLQFTIHPRFTDTWWYKGLLAILILSIAGLIVYQIFRYQKLKSKNFVHLLKAEFKSLNYQINPHFIFNVMNSIQYYILRKDTDRAVHFLNSFSQLIRHIVTNSKQQYISVLEEVECLQEYMDLEKLRLDNKFDYEINMDSNLDIQAKILLPMIIQPLVENAIWHGIVPSGKMGKVKVDFKKQGNTLIVAVEDNGVGLRYAETHRKSPKHLSIAMSNIEERLKIIGELSKSNWYIRMQDKKELGLDDTGTIVTIKFPEIIKN